MLLYHNNKAVEPYNLHVLTSMYKTQFNMFQNTSQRSLPSYAPWTLPPSIRSFFHLVKKVCRPLPRSLLLVCLHLILFNILFLLKRQISSCCNVLSLSQNIQNYCSIKRVNLVLLKPSVFCNVYETVSIRRKQSSVHVHPSYSISVLYPFEYS